MNEVKSCVTCSHSSGIRSNVSEPFSYYCHWLDSVLPPPLVDAIHNQIDGPPFIEPEDYQVNAEICPHYELQDEPLPAEPPQ